MEERKIQRARRRALQSSLIQDLQAQYSETPEEFQVIIFWFPFEIELEKGCIGLDEVV